MSSSDDNSMSLPLEETGLQFFSLMASHRLGTDRLVAHLDHMDKDNLLSCSRKTKWKEPGLWRALSFRAQSTLSVTGKKHKHLSCLITLLGGAYLLQQLNLHPD